MSKRNLMVVTAGVVLAFLAASVSFAEEKGKNEKGTGDRASASTIQGKIMRVDPEKRTLVLGEVKRGAGIGGDKGTGGTTGTGGDKGTGTGDKGTGTGDKGTGGDKGSANQGQELTLMVAENAQITLDGKKAELRDLRQNQFARVSLRQSDRGTGGDKGTTGKGTEGDKGTTGKGTEGNKSGAEKGTGAGNVGGRNMTVDRIDAFSKEPGKETGK